ncbi:hypothetical protein [Dactylosporangium sp. CA-233914]|uniref:hypothetical protein n=1 Tax=Dactylosporangium sp. CA-233914 TaxID=3239934 RepID=UPI003D8D30A8
MAGYTAEVRVGGTPGAITTGYTPAGRLCRVDLRVGGHGSQLAGLAEALSTAITEGLRHGAPAEEYRRVLALALDPVPDGQDEHGELLITAVNGTVSRPSTAAQPATDPTLSNAEELH